MIMIEKIQNGYLVSLSDGGKILGSIFFDKLDANFVSTVEKTLGPIDTKKSDDQEQKAIPGFRGN